MFLGDVLISNCELKQMAMHAQYSVCTCRIKSAAMDDTGSEMWGSTVRGLCAMWNKSLLWKGSWK